MQFTATILAALATAASAQKVQVVTVSSTNNSLTYSPDNIKAAVGDMVQFQFVAGNHTVTQSAFDSPCQPINSVMSNVTGFHSGYMPVAASQSSGMIPTYTVMVNATTPMWVYCAQGRHCESGMVMVINENTSANSSRSLANFKQLASAQTGSTAPTTGTTGGSSGTGTAGTAGTTTGASTGGSGMVKVGSSLGLAVAAVAVMLL